METSVSDSELIVSLIYEEILIVMSYFSNGYPENLTSRGILTDGPDYSHLDGNPTPYTTGQRARIIKQRQQAVSLHTLGEPSTLAFQCYLMCFHFL